MLLQAARVPPPLPADPLRGGGECAAVQVSSPRLHAAEDGLPRVEPPQGDSAQGAGGHHGEGPDPGHEGGAGAALPQQRVPSNPATSRPWPCVM